VAAGLQDLTEVLPGEVSGLIVTAAEIIRDMAADSKIARRTRTLHHAQAPMQSHALAVVKVEVVDAMCVECLVVTVATTRRSKQQSFDASRSHGHRRFHPTTDHRETIPGIRQRATGLRHLSSARSPSTIIPSVRSTAAFQPDLYWDAGRTKGFDECY